MDLHSSTIRTVTAPGAPGNTITLGPGTVRYVDSNGGGSTTSGGLTRASAFTTLASALTASSAGDTIILMEGHAETGSASGNIFSCSLAGVKIVGEGTGSRRPTFTFSHTGATSAISGAGVMLKNVLFVTGVDSVTTYCTVSGTDFICEDVETRDTTDVEVIDDFTVTGARPTFRRLFKNGYTSGDANARVLKFNGVARGLVEGCRFITKVTTAVINFVTGSCTGIEVRSSHFYVNSTTNYSKDVVDTIGSSTWSVFDDCFDLGAGSHFQGGSGAALAGVDVSAITAALLVPSADVTDNTNERDVIGNKTDAAVTTGTTNKSLMAYTKGVLSNQIAPTADSTATTLVRDSVGIKTDASVYVPAATKSLMGYAKGTANLQEKVAVSATAAIVNGDTLFTITGGPIQIMALVSECMTNNDVTASTLQYQCVPTSGSAQTVSAASASLGSATAGATVTLAGTALSTAALYNANGPNLIANPGTIIAPAGTIKAVVGVGSTTGTWRHLIRYKPLAVGVSVA